MAIFRVENHDPISQISATTYQINSYIILLAYCSFIIILILVAV